MFLAGSASLGCEEFADGAAHNTAWFDAKNKIRKGALSTPTYIHMRIQLDNPSVLTVMTAAAAIAATAALFSLSASVRRPPSNKRSVTFSVMHWNVLASPFTFFNREPPKCVQGHRNPAAETETSSQQRARYSLASDQLLGASGPTRCSFKRPSKHSSRPTQTRVQHNYLTLTRSTRPMTRGRARPCSCASKVAR